MFLFHPSHYQSFPLHLLSVVNCFAFKIDNYYNVLIVEFRQTGNSDFLPFIIFLIHLITKVCFVIFFIPFLFSSHMTNCITLIIMIIYSLIVELILKLRKIVKKYLMP